MKKSSIFLAATMVAGISVTVLPSPADAGGRRAYCPCVCTSDGGVCGRDCGRYCDRGPYGGGYGYGGGYNGGYRGNQSFGVSTVTIEKSGRWIHIHERTRTYFRIRVYD
ncbi:hypothetical protein HYW59_04455 [Candidatus Kaiserbacteria bacterium]|nr:hypothetical protein [Candidatus Kaiserbacteria bacterium]